MKKMTHALIGAPAGLAAILAAPATTSVQEGRLQPAQIIAARQSAFHLSAATFGTMKGVIDSGGDVKQLVFASRGLARWARTIPSMFPAETSGAPSQALPAVWESRAEFDEQAARYRAASQRLAEFAAAGDAAGFKQQWETTRSTCNACHTRFRAEPLGSGTR